MITIITGDDERIPITLKKGGNTFVISQTAVIKVAIVDKNHTKVLAGPVIVDKAEPGSNLATSSIVAIIPGKITEMVTPQQAQIEVEINDDGKNSWHADIKLVKGLIK